MAQHAKVLIAGAGPVGLTLANELARYGVPVRVVDKAAARTDKSKALVLWSRTLELFDHAGYVDQFLPAEMPAHGAIISTGKEVIARISLDDIDSLYPYALMIAQSETERVLEEHLAKRGVAVERNVALESFVEQGAQIQAVLRETKLASGSFEVGANVPTLVELPVATNTQGAVRVTLFSQRNEPLSERLLYHGAGSGLQISMTTENKTYSPRDPVKVRIKTTDAAGKPVKANIGVAVVDETVLAYADDKSGNLVSRMLLEQELGATKEDPIEDPRYYFGDKLDAAAALDALLATRGYRRFEWRPVLELAKTQGGAQ